MLEIIVLRHKQESLNIKNWQTKYTNVRLKYFKSAKYTHLNEIAYEELILQTCDQYANTKRGLDSCCVSLIFIANMFGLFR